MVYVEDSLPRCKGRAERAKADVRAAISLLYLPLYPISYLYIYIYIYTCMYVCMYYLV